MTTEPSSPTGLKYRQVRVDTLSKGRRGKHHDLVVGVVRELETLPFGEAMQISLADAGGIGLANLRAAVHRAAASRELQIGTRADDQNFYVWKKE
jgi:hypothetical protein